MALVQVFLPILIAMMWIANVNSWPSSILRECLKEKFITNCEEWGPVMDEIASCINQQLPFAYKSGTVNFLLYLHYNSAISKRLRISICDKSKTFNMTDPCVQNLKEDLNDCSTQNLALQTKVFQEFESNKIALRSAIEQSCGIFRKTTVTCINRNSTSCSDEAVDAMVLWYSMYLFDTCAASGGFVVRRQSVDVLFVAFFLLVMANNDY